LGKKRSCPRKKIAGDILPKELVAWALSGEKQTGPSIGTDTLPASSSLSELLSPREREIAEEIARGLSNHDIATKLYVSVRTVDAHVRHILNKLGLNSRTQVVIWFAADHYNPPPMPDRIPR